MLCVLVVIGVMISLSDNSSSIEPKTSTTSTSTTPAYKLSVIADLSSEAKRKEAETRFAFVLPRLAKRCKDVEEEINVADMLVVGHNSLKDAGLGSKEPLTDFTDTIYSMVSELYPLSETTFLNLAEVIAAYVTLRLSLIHI